VPDVFVHYEFLLSSSLQHANKEPVNDVEELQLILNKAIKALKSLLTVVDRHLPASAATEGTHFLGLRVSTCVVTSTTILKENTEKQENSIHAIGNIFCPSHRT
jgi:hypothetical protein